ncbi:MAG TPA: FmdB family zinc ribbon protein [Actinomycetota bacterium]|nr:FmdB family zinc ribbon protein [Actinomycetota bacterium]
MPTYEYECTACGQHIEVFQRFSEDPLTTCGVCGGRLRKVFHPAGIVFKGSGFYATDSRSKAPSGASKDSDGASSSSSSSSGASGSDGSASKGSDGGSSSQGSGGGSSSKGSNGGSSSATGSKKEPTPS